jgi:hypothetical protein
MVTNFGSHFGKSRAQLAEHFPGTANEIPNWNGFKKLYLFFNTNGEFNQAGVVLAAPVSEKDAMEAVQARLGIDLSKYKPIVSGAAVRFEGLGGSIKSVTLKRDFPGRQISEITVTAK